MDYLVTLQFLIISCVIGICLSFFLNIKSYLLIAVICALIFICIELYYNYKLLETSKPNTNPNTNIILQPENLNKVIPSILDYAFSPKNILTSTSPTISVGTTITSDGSLLTLPASAIGNSTEMGMGMSTLSTVPITNIPVPNTSVPNTSVPLVTHANRAENNAVGLVDTKDTEFSMDKPPFDGLGPSELMSRLNYIYYATANPANVINYHEFKTHADKYLDEDGTKLSTNDTKLQGYSGFYPQLTIDQINARDCLNEGSGPRSCFQSPQLFYNAKNNFNILEKGINLDNANLVVREDFSMPMNLNPATRYDPILFMNAPQGNLDKPLDQQSNERIDLSADAMSICHNCKLAVCKDDICSLQNKLFM